MSENTQPQMNMFNTPIWKSLSNYNKPHKTLKIDESTFAKFRYKHQNKIEEHKTGVSPPQAFTF